MLTRSRRLAGRGLRVLMVAEGSPATSLDDPQELTALGFVGISDPLLKILNHPGASKPVRCVGELLEGAAKPVGCSSEATIQLQSSTKKPRYSIMRESRMLADQMKDGRAKISAPK